MVTHRLCPAHSQAAPRLSLLWVVLSIMKKNKWIERECWKYHLRCGFERRTPLKFYLNRILNKIKRQTTHVIWKKSILDSRTTVYYILRSWGGSGPIWGRDLRCYNPKIVSQIGTVPSVSWQKKNDLALGTNTLSFWPLASATYHRNNSHIANLVLIHSTNI